MQWEKLLSTARLRQQSFEPDPFDKRTSFDADFDRVVTSSSFRRMQDKTQVFPLEAHDFVRTRLTHSTEVAAVGRALGISAAKCLKDTEKVAGDYQREWSTIVSTACLLHDIGNPPFGHSGERFIASWFAQKLASPDDANVQRRGGAPLELSESQEIEDLRNFEGNAHAFRVATRLQSLGDSFGMNLTCGTLAALIKYPCCSTDVDKQKGKHRSKFGYFKSDAKAFDAVQKAVGLNRFQRHPLAYLVEAADDISYSVADIEDALKKRVVSFELIVDYLEALPSDQKRLFLDEGLKKYHGKSTATASRTEREQQAFQKFRALAAGKMTASCVEAFVKNFDEINNREWFNELPLVMSLAPLCEQLKKLGKEHVYSTSEVVRVEASGRYAIWGLLDIFYDELKYTPKSKILGVHLPPTPSNPDDSEDGSPAYRDAQRVADFVAGMTDTFAMSLFRRLTGVSA